MTGTLFNTVESIYANIERDDGWDRILNSLSRLTGAKSGCIVSAPPGMPGSNVGCFYNIDPDWIEAYNDYYYQFDPTPAFMQAHPGQLRRDHVTGPRPIEMTAPRRTFFHEVMRPQQFRHTLALGLSTDLRWSAGLVLQRSSRQGPFSSKAASIVKQLSGHLSQALRLHAQLTQANGLQASMATTLANSPVAVLLLDEQGRTVFINRRGEALLANNHTIEVKNDVFRAVLNKENAVLQRLIRNAVAAGQGNPGGGSGKMWVQNSVHVNLTPIVLSETDSPILTRKVCAAVWLSEQDNMLDKISPEVLQRCYDLTTVEAKLLFHLVKGLTLTEVAQMRAVKFETVRSQLKNIKSKLGVSRQTDLIRIVLSEVPHM